MYIKNEEGVLSHESGLGRTLGQGIVSESRMISPRPLDEVSPDVPQGQGPVVNCWAAMRTKSKSTKSSFPRSSSRGCLRTDGLLQACVIGQSLTNWCTVHIFKQIVQGKFRLTLLPACVYS